MKGLRRFNGEGDYPSASAAKQRQQELDDQVSAFLAKGGSIQQVAEGVSANPDGRAGLSKTSIHERAQRAIENSRKTKRQQRQARAAKAVG